MNESPQSTQSTPTLRMVAALHDPDYRFTQEQMLRLISLAIGTEDDLAWRAGYEAGHRARVAEENAAWPPPPVFAFGEWQSMTERQAYRARLDADRTQRYAGGPVEVWEATRPDLPDLGPSASRWHPRAGVPVRSTRDGLVWA